VLIGATLKVDEIPYWEPKIPENHIMRIFPDSDGLPPDKTDERFDYCTRVGAIPFISTKVDGDNTKIAALKTYLEDLLPDFDMVYLTDRHEPEGDIAAATFIANFNEVLAMVDTLSAPLRAKIKCGPVLTRQATENKPVATPTVYTGSNPTGGVYSTYDPGTGDFFGVDFYGNSWSSTDSSTAVTAFVPPATILSKVKVYKKTSGDTRPRWFPEIGYIGAPFDTNGNARAQWLAGVVAEVGTWNSGNVNWTMPWEFAGLIWWNAQGKSGSSLTGIGKSRWFQLDRHHNGTAYGSDPIGGYNLITGAPPLARFNELVAAQDVTPPDPDPDDPDPDTDPDPEDPEDVTTTFVATPEPNNVPPRILLELEYTGETEATITRLDPDGRTRTVRLGEPATLSSDTWVGYDYESWLDGTATYTAATSAGNISTTEVTLESGADPTSGLAWLRHPGIPSLSVRVEILPPLDERTHGVNQAVLQPLGRRFPVVVSDGRRKAATSSLTFRTFDEDDAAALRDILDDVSILLLDAPQFHGLGFTHEYLAFGELRERRFDPSYGPNPWRNWTVGYTVVDKPAGGQLSQRTWATLVVEQATWTTTVNTYDTWSDALTGAV
jgi:hypothetical protein